MDDVLDEFISVDVILQHMLEWKNKYLNSYIEAYVNVCLPKLVGPYVRLEMLMWNPLEVNIINKIKILLLYFYILLLRYFIGYCILKGFMFIYIYF